MPAGFYKHKIRIKISKNKLIYYYIIKKFGLRKIGKLLHCSCNTIKRRLKKYNIKCRNIKQAAKVSHPNGQNSFSWNGGKWTDNHGYVFIYCPNHPHKTHKIYVLEHRLIMENHIGRYLKPDEIIHHLNGIRDDNRIENLCITSSNKHEKHTYIKTLQKRIRCLEQKIKKEK